MSTSKHTPGPWTWFTSSHGPYLATPDRGRLYVMDFTRKGMGGATPRFARWNSMAFGADRDRCGGIMHDGVTLENGTLHPDAKLIEASPDLLSELQTEETWIANLIGDCEASRLLKPEVIAENLRARLKSIRETISKATTN